MEPHGRNPSLADAMKRIGLAEKTGRGIDRIFEGSIIFGRPWPDYSDSTSKNVKLFIQRAKADLSFARFIADEQNRRGKPLSIYMLMILSVINSERRVNVKRLVEATNLSENKIRSAVENMVEQGLIEASGQGKNRSFILGKKIYRAKKETIKYVRQTDIDNIRYLEMVMRLAEAQEGVVTKQDIVELLNVTPPQAYAIIKQLQQEGKLRIVCKGKYARYQLVK